MFKRYNNFEELQTGQENYTKINKKKRSRENYKPNCRKRNITLRDLRGALGENGTMPYAGPRLG